MLKDGMIQEYSLQMDQEEEDTLLKLLMNSVIQQELPEEEMKILFLSISYKIYQESNLKRLLQEDCQFQILLDSQQLIQKIVLKLKQIISQKIQKKELINWFAAISYGLKKMMLEEKIKVISLDLPLVKQLDLNILELLNEVKMDGEQPVEVICEFLQNTEQKPKSYLHWISQEDSVDCTVRLYENLFNEHNPNELEDYIKGINSQSLQTMKNSKINKNLLKAKAEDKFQFERLGYFVLDQDSTATHKVWNRTVTLQDREKQKAQKRQDKK